MMSSFVDANGGDDGEDVCRFGLGRTIKRSTLIRF